MIDRQQYLEELKLRSFIRKAIKVVNERKKRGSQEQLTEETKLRSIIQKMLIQEREAVADTPPHQSTGINVLEDLLKKIIPVLETDYKVLTTRDENDPGEGPTVQRQSFRSHIINGVQNLLAPARAVAGETGQETELAEKVFKALEEEDINIDVEDEGEDAAFIDIGGYSAEEEAEPEDEFTISGEDITGRNVALQSFNKIEQNILDSYELLSGQEDRKLFYDYLLTNLKLYFDKFEDELKSAVGEPTTPEYEQEKETQGGLEGEEDLEL